MTVSQSEGTWPSFSDEEILAAERVLRSGRVNYWTGTECKEFEEEFARYHGAGHAISLANGTLALELALRCLDIGAGDEVIVTPRSYFASASCVVPSGATPVFAEVDSETQNISARTIEQKLSVRTKAIIPVHLAGWPCDMSEIMELARGHDLKVIEDCAQAHGAKLRDEPVGSFGDFAAFSFCQDKIMTTAGEGGMLLTDDSDLWRRAWEFKDHGKSMPRVHSDDHPIGFRWLHEGFGSNWRMTEVQAAIGRIQLKKLDEWVSQRRANAARFRQELDGLPALRIPMPESHEYHSYYKFYAFVRPELLRRDWSRDRILSSFQEHGVPGLSGACPEIYLERAFAKETIERLPVAQALGETSMMFLVHPTLTAAQLDATVSVVRRVMSEATA